MIQTLSHTRYQRLHVHSLGLLITAPLQLDLPVFEAPLRDDHTHRHPNELPVRKHGAWPLPAVVVAYHITYEIDSVMELLDRERPSVIINYAAQGEGAVSWKKS